MKEWTLDPDGVDVDGFFLEANPISTAEAFGPASARDRSLGLTLVAEQEVFLTVPDSEKAEAFGPDVEPPRGEVGELLLGLPEGGGDLAILFADGQAAGLAVAKRGGKLVLRIAKAGLRWLGKHDKLVLKWFLARASTKVASFVDDLKGFRELVRPMDPGNWQAEDGLPSTDWPRYTAGRSLLMIHGTGRACHKGFGQGSAAGEAGFKALHSLYGGRVLGLDYRVFSQSPRRNVKTLMDALPASQELEVDILAISRGGLVARQMTEAVGRKGISAIKRLSVRRVVFVGTPNAGTQLASEDKLKELIQDALLVPELFAKFVQVWGLELILSVAKLLLNGVVSLATRFPGLSCQAPGSELLTKLNGPDINPLSAQYYAVQAALTADALLKKAAIAAYTKLAFDELENDLIVPTLGCAAPSGVTGPTGSFPVTGPKLLELRVPGQTHQNYFENASVWDHIMASLKAK